MFFTWTFLFGLMRMFKTHKKPSPLILLFIGFFFGVLIEILQHYLPINRSSEVYDLIANALGSITAIPAITVFYKKLFS